MITPRTRCAPLPLVRRGWGWGSELQDVSRATTTAPTPGRSRAPSPTRGRVKTEFAARSFPSTRLRWGSPVVRSRHGLDQHGAALPAADAFGGDALLDAEAFHGVDQMQHDAVAA